MHTLSANVLFSRPSCSFLSVNFFSSASHFVNDFDVESVVLRSEANCNDKWLSFSWPFFISDTSFVISIVNLVMTQINSALKNRPLNRIVEFESKS